MSNNPVTTRWADLDGQLFFPRELSWLSFNARVLQEAQNPAVPLIERVRYLGIFSNNLDEFFRVRVAEVRRLISVSSCLLYTSPSPRDATLSRMPSSA